jgi:CRISPR-associated protein Csb2
MVASAARSGTLEKLREAFKWLELLGAPTIIAPLAVMSAVGYRLSVPHNSMDIVGKQWSRGEDGDVAKHRTMKSVRPHQLASDAAVHYLWGLDDAGSHARDLIAAARRVVSLGWGQDLVVGNGAIISASQIAELRAIQVAWEPRTDGSYHLRSPVEGTLDDLERRHSAFISRTSYAAPTLRPPPLLSKFAVTSYARSDQSRRTEIAGFTLVRVDSNSLRSFDSAKRGMAVSGMLRHTVRKAAQRSGWSYERVMGSVLGHGIESDPRLLLVPVPSIEPRGNGSETVGAVRRALIFSADINSADAAWAARTLGGMDLVDEHTGEVQAVLAIAPREDRVFKRYLQESATWTTVTPMVLPGHDDPGGLRSRIRRTTSPSEQRALLERLARRRDALVRKALRHAAVSDDLVFSASIEISETGFIAGVEKASRYAVPSHLVKSPRFHVKLTWPTKIPGPICIGRGRFSGMGLFASISE